MIREKEGYITVPGGRVWYKISGTGPGVPLLVLHGGPGFPYNSLKPLAALGDERPVIFYDQLGCGQSDRPFDPALWQLERFVEELATVRAALELAQVNILGHSWGAMLATDYALTQPPGLTKLVLASPCLSVTRWLSDQAAYRQQLPAEMQAVLDQREAAGTTDSLEYQAATEQFYQRHVCRLNPWPAEMLESRAGFGFEVYSTMWGVSEFYMSGNLADYERTARLAEITLPTLFTCGRYDEATPQTVEEYRRLLPGAQLAVFEQSAHMAHLEETAAYLARLRSFLP